MLNRRLDRSIKNLIAWGFSVLPRWLSASLFTALCRALNIEGVSFKGNNGEFFGPAFDQKNIGAYIRDSDYSPDLLSLLLEHLKDGGTYIDIGANIGLLAAPIARTGTRTICFEPDPSNFRWLQLNLNGQADLHNVALYDSEGTLDFELSPTNSGDNRILSNNPGKPCLGEDKWDVVSVPTKRLDDILQADSLAPPIVVKIDTQGAEVPIFRGGENLLKEADLLVFEYTPYLARRQGQDERELIDFIQKNFTKGSVVEASTSDKIAFRPVSDAIPRLLEISENPANIRWADIIVRK